jgi:hypothetical protein
LQDFSETPIQLEFLLDDGHEHVNADGNPDLRLHRVDAGAIEEFYIQILLDPFEEQLDMASIFVNFGDGQRRQYEIVGQEHEPTVVFGIVIRHPTQQVGVSTRGLRAGQYDRLVASQSRCLVHNSTAPTFEVETAFGTRHEECQTGREPMKTLEIDIGAIHDIERAGLDREKVEKGSTEI